MTTHHYAICMYTDPVGQSLEPFIMFEKEANAVRQLLNIMDTQKDLTFFRMTVEPESYCFAEKFIYFRELNEVLWTVIGDDDTDKLFDAGHDPIDGGVDTGDENYKVAKCLLNYVEGRDICKVLELFK